jgi:hypothetical protein
VSDEISDCGIENSHQGCVAMYIGTYVSLSLSLQSFGKRVDLINDLTLRRLMSYVCGAPILDVSRSHTTQHSR